MKTVVLFDKGNVGGLLLTENGVRSIPPFDSVVRQSLKSAAAMVISSFDAAGTASGPKLAKLSVTLCNMAIGDSATFWRSTSWPHRSSR